jgi:probable selenium-dependent hydroxylase accessory protein YqeC
MNESLLELLGCRRLVALVGGGGKTATGERLVEEAAAAGRKALLTTTTKMLAAAPFPVRLFRSAREAAAALGPADLPALVARADRAKEKIAGFDPDEVPFLLGVADLVVVEADGARRLPIKAFAPDEPVLPPEVDDYLIVVGLAAIGRTIDEGEVHRPERLARVVGAPMGSRLTEELVSRAVLSPGGYLSAAPEGARVSVLLWGATSPVRRRRARALAEILVSDRRVRRVVAGDLLAREVGFEMFGDAARRGSGRTHDVIAPSQERE